MEYHNEPANDIPLPLDDVARLAARIRAGSIGATTAAGSGHPTSALSMADLLATLLARHLRYRLDAPDHPGNDRLVLSKGHAVPAIYAGLEALGVIDEKELLTLRGEGSRLQGHPMPTGLPLIDVPTGSLGQGLSVGLGMALGLRRLDSPGRVFVILGDSEMTEGSVWEAMFHAGHQRLDGLVALLDMNRLGQTGPTMLGWDGDGYARRAESFGWTTMQIDGHDVSGIDQALDAATSRDGPVLVIAKTVKGKGVSFLEDKPDKHGRALDDADAERAIAELGDVFEGTITLRPPPEFEPRRQPARNAILPAFDEPVSTREAFGVALAAEAQARPELVVLDAEVSNSTMTEKVAEAHPDDFVEMYIAEQNMVGAAMGLSAVGFVPVAATFGAFLTRAHDFIRMAALGEARVILCGSHAGVEIGEDGPSQMALEDIGMMRSLPGAVVVYPADGNSTCALLGALLDQDGVGYLRTTRGATPRLYGPDEEFHIGGSKVHRSAPDDDLTLVAAGVTLFEALQASERLSESGVGARVIDVYSVAPIDTVALRRSLEDTGRMIVVEDHRRAGGLGEAVLSAVGGSVPGEIRHLAVDGIPGSAPPDRQLELAGISVEAILTEAEKLLTTAPASATPS